VARLQSVTRAADELETSQQYVSKQIAVLEEQLGAPLFLRVGRRLYLTPAGELLNQHARTAMESLRLAEDELLRSASASHGRLRIATSTTGVYMLPKWLASFEASGAQLETAIMVTSCDEVERQIIAGEADLGVVAVARALAVLSRESWLRMIWRWRFKETIRLSRVRSIRLEDLRKERFIVREPQSASRALTEQRFFQKNPDCRRRLQIDHIDAVKNSIQEGLGVSFVSKRAIERGAVRRVRCNFSRRRRSA
jgi:DNA-binding transcriptional LysR family regulator